MTCEDVDLHRDVRQVLDERKPLERPRAVARRQGLSPDAHSSVPHRRRRDRRRAGHVRERHGRGGGGRAAAPAGQRAEPPGSQHAPGRDRPGQPDPAALAGPGHVREIVHGTHAGAGARLRAAVEGRVARSAAAGAGTHSAAALRGGARVAIHSNGPAVLLTANAALAMGMVLYELATNATKYGALSVSTGRIEVSWQLEHRAGRNPSSCSTGARSTDRP